MFAKSLIRAAVVTVMLVAGPPASSDGDLQLDILEELTRDLDALEQQRPPLFPSPSYSREPPAFRPYNLQRPYSPAPSYSPDPIYRPESQAESWWLQQRRQERQYQMERELREIERQNRRRRALRSPSGRRLPGTPFFPPLGQ